MKVFHFSLLCLFLLGLQFSFAQTNEAKEDSTKNDFRKIDILPAISYAPETKLTLGAIGFYNFDLGKNHPTTRSYVQFLGIYTTANQTAIESKWEIFTDDDLYRIRGEMVFARFPDRNYGLGNDAGVRLVEYDLKEGQIRDSAETNYARYTINRFKINPSVIRRVYKHLSVGVALDLEYQYNYKILGDSVKFLEQGEEVIALGESTPGFRFGAGIMAVWDSRDKILNPLRGSFIEVNNLYYGNGLGSDYKYIRLDLDVRKYFNPVSNHTIALRAILHNRFVDTGLLPMQGLARIGGDALMRGYFRGTYQDDGLFSFMAEYRLPFWKEGKVEGSVLKFWKRLGMVAFVSAGQVYNQDGNFGFDRFNYAVGTGLRVLFNKESRVNIRIDYAIGLNPDSNGPDSRQSGFYFNLAEAF